MSRDPHRRARSVAADRPAPHEPTDVRGAVLALPREPVGPVPRSRRAGSDAGAGCGRAGIVQGCVVDNDAAARGAARPVGVPGAASARCASTARYDDTDAERRRRRATVLARARRSTPSRWVPATSRTRPRVTLAGHRRGRAPGAGRPRLRRRRAPNGCARAPERVRRARLGVHPSVDPWYPVSASIAVGTRHPAPAPLRLPPRRARLHRHRTRLTHPSNVSASKSTSTTRV